MKGAAPIALAVALLACVPLLTSSNVVLNFMVVALLMKGERQAERWLRAVARRVRFLDEDRVVVNDDRESDPGYCGRREAVLRRHGLAVERLTYFQTDEEHDGLPSAAGCYVNFLRVGGLVVVPAYGVPQDDLACRTLERLLPGATVVPLRCEGLAREGGVLNCVAWTVRAPLYGHTGTNNLGSGLKIRYQSSG